MGAYLTGLKPVTADDWNHRRIELDEERRPHYKMSAGRYSWLMGYVESVAPGMLLRQWQPAKPDDDPHLESGRFHEQDCIDIAAVLTAELETGRPEAYCRAMEYRRERPPTSPLDVDDIRDFRDFLAMCGGYGWD